MEAAARQRVTNNHIDSLLVAGYRQAPVDGAGYLRQLAPHSFDDHALNSQNFIYWYHVTQSLGHGVKDNGLVCGGTRIAFRLPENFPHPPTPLQPPSRIRVKPRAEFGEGLKLLELCIRQFQRPGDLTQRAQLGLPANSRY